MVQIFAGVGSPNRQFNGVGSINFRLVQQLAAYKREDTLPRRVRPLPISVLHTLDSAVQVSTDSQQSISDLAWILFFFLLWPGYYCQGGTDTVSTLFWLWNIQFFIGNQLTPATTMTLQECAAAKFFSLLFITQNNGVKGKFIDHGTTGHPRACAVADIRRREAYIQHHGSTSHTPLYIVFHNNKWTSLHSTDITKALWAPVSITGPQVGFTPEEFSVNSMRPGGAMTLLMVWLDTDMIWLVGRWRINMIIRYPHTSPQVLHRALRRSWSNMRTMHSSQPPKGDIAPFPQLWDSLRPSLGSSWGPITG